LATVPRIELQQRIADRIGEFLIFAVTPPRLTTEPEQTRQIAEITLARLRSVGIDGLVLYDIDDESDRNPNERPFPFLPTMDPAEYLARDLVGLDVPAIVYRAVGKHAEDGLRLWLREQDPARMLSVFVGASSREKAVATSLSRAYELRTEVRPDLPLGGIAIPERHARGGTEHLRLIAKQAAGCSFFVTQVVYDVNAAKDLVSDYRYECAARNPSRYRSSSHSQSAAQRRHWSSSSGSVSTCPAGSRTICATLRTPSTRPTIKHSRRRTS
jgi:hypothetical protein